MVSNFNPYGPPAIPDLHHGLLGHSSHQADAHDNVFLLLRGDRLRHRSGCILIRIAYIWSQSHLGDLVLSDQHDHRLPERRGPESRNPT